MSRICITGIGIISALGDSLNANLEALRSGICGIGKAGFVRSRYAETLLFGEVKISDDDLKARLGIFNPGITRTSLLALHAFRQAIDNSNLTKDELASADTALICASTVGGMCMTDELFMDSLSETEGSVYMSAYDCASVTLFLREHAGIKGVCNTINTACSSSANAIMFGARLIRNGLANRAIVGGVDSLAKFTINGFNSLAILAPQHCKPFDKDRNGLNLGEGAAFLVLEKEEDAHRKKNYATLAGYCNSNDAFHPSSLSETGEGPYRAMKGALDSASLAPDEIGFVNTHGTGTENNDEVESKAMMRIFQNVPPFISSKSRIGHTLGASAAIEASFGILAMNHGEVFPSLNFSTPIESTGLRPVTRHQKMEFKNIMTNSFGFGGNCASLIFSKA